MHRGRLVGHAFLNKGEEVMARNIMLLLLIMFVVSCVHPVLREEAPERLQVSGVDLTTDPQTGVPYAATFQFPLVSFDASDFGFGFGEVNEHFCLQATSDGCSAYGAHLGRDSLVKKTPVGTPVFATSDGIVRVTTDKTFGGYGADSSQNANYRGCLLVLEHEFASGERFTELYGHVQCEASAGYDASQAVGNPPVGTLVKRGQYLAHVAHYWSGTGMATDWHHLHWAMRRGAFDLSHLAAYVLGYDLPSTFTYDPTTGGLTHPHWIDPFTVVKANGDPAHTAQLLVRNHPSGCLLQDPEGGVWQVQGDARIAFVSSQIFERDRYDASHLVAVSADELACYTVAAPLVSPGVAVAAKRTGSSTVMMAYPESSERYDVIRWEALLSWGFAASDILDDPLLSNVLDQTYTDKGYRRLRPGTLVKADEASEVAIVTAEQTRRPIASAEVFEALGFRWEQVVSIPQDVLTAVAGPREAELITWEGIHTCAAPASCPNGEVCGGGSADPDPPDAGMSDHPVESCNGLDDDGNGLADETFICKLGAVGNICITLCQTSGQLRCTAPACEWGECQPYAEQCDNTIDDDCNGLVDCADPLCALEEICLMPSDSSEMGGAGSSGGTGGSVPAAGGAAGTSSDPAAGGSGPIGDSGGSGASGSSPNSLRHLTIRALLKKEAPAPQEAFMYAGTIAYGDMRPTDTYATWQGPYGFPTAGGHCGVNAPDNCLASLNGETRVLLQGAYELPANYSLAWQMYVVWPAGIGPVEQSYLCSPGNVVLPGGDELLESVEAELDGVPISVAHVKQFETLPWSFCFVTPLSFVDP
jgi:hypothetical protein